MVRPTDSTMNRSAIASYPRYGYDERMNRIFSSWKSIVWPSCVVALCLHAVCAVPVAAAATGSELGVEWVSFHYSEPDSAKMREDGSMVGVFATYSWAFDRMALRAEVSYDWGTIDYDGWLIDFETGEMMTPIQLDTPNSVLNMRLTGGPRLKMGTGTATITPVTGLGFRFLLNDLPGYGGYTREQTYWYVPVGVEASGRLGDGWGYVLRAEYDFFLSGSNDSGGDHFTQDTGYGLHVSVGLSSAFAGPNPITVTLEPFFRYWNVDDSSVTPDGWFEPANHCSEYGIKCSVLF